MRLALLASAGLALTMAAATAAATQAAEPTWEPVRDVIPGTPSLFYSPSSARTETDRGATIRVVDVRAEHPNGQIEEATWKVNANTCQSRLVDVAIYGKDGQFQGVQRSLSTLRDPMAQAVCGLTIRLDSPNR